MDDPRMGINMRNGVLFYLIVPFILAVIFTLSGAGNQPIESFSGNILYWIVSVGLVWLLLSIGTGLASPLMRWMNAPLIVTLMIGYGIGLPIYKEAEVLRNMLIEDFVTEGSQLLPAAGMDGPYGSISLFLLGSTLWITLNYFFYYFLGAERFGYRLSAEERWRIFNQLKLSGSEDSSENLSFTRQTTHFFGVPVDSINFLEADDHYTHVGLNDGTRHFHVRFSDAVTAMDPANGMQVHRSYWVALKAIQRFDEQGHKANVILKDGKHIPVSRTFKKPVRDRLSIFK